MPRHVPPWERNLEQQRSMYAGVSQNVNPYMSASDYASIEHAVVAHLARTEVNMPLDSRTIALTYDEHSDRFSYVLNNDMNNVGGSVEGFVRQHTPNYRFLPALGSAEFAELLQMGSSSEMERSRAAPANEHSIVISYNEETDLYHIQSATSFEGSSSGIQERSLDGAYSVARRIKAQHISEEYGKPWHVWPRKGSLPHRDLLEKNDSTVKAATIFSSIFADLNKSLSSKSIDNEALLQSVIKQIIRMRNKHGMGAYSINDQLNKYIKVVTGVEYINATYSESGNNRFAHPDNVKKAYQGWHKNDGHYYYNSIMVKKLCKECDDCKDLYRSNRLTSVSQLSGYYCSDCLDTKGYYKCGAGCSGWHQEDEGCPVYHGQAREYIYGYSVDVRSYIHKMFKMPEDKKINGEYLRYGVELEVLPKNDVVSKTAKYNCGSALHNYALLKSDSSLGSNGFEIVTAPATLEFHRKVLWEDFFKTNYMDKLTAAKSVQSWHTNVCGIHVHVTRAALTEMQLSKMLVFYHEPYNSGFLSRIAGREVGPNAVYCKAAKKKLRASVTDECGDHHGAITISRRNHGKTAEVRIFRGNATYHGVMRAVEFVDATVKWCGQNASGDVVDYKNFLNWFNQPTIKRQYPELRKHLIDLKYLKPRLKEGEVAHPKATTDVVKPELKQA